MANSLPVAKNLIEYNIDDLEENDVEEKESIDIVLTKQKAGPEMMKILLTLNYRLYKKKTRKILLWLTSLRANKSKLMRKIFKKNN